MNVMKQSYFHKHMMKHLGICIAVIGAFSISDVRAEEFSELLSKVPSSANAVIAIDADGLRNSEMGILHKWGEKNEAAYVNSAFILPPESDRIVVASQMNPNNDFAETWGVAVMSLTDSLSARAIARSEGGTVDEIGGLPAVWSPSDAYFISFSDDVLGIMTPSNRQVVSRWVSSTTKKSPFNGSVFLEDSILSLGGDSQIVMAIDLKDAITPHQAENALTKIEVIKDNPVQIKDWKNLILSFTGIRLTIAVDKGITGQLSIQFGTDPSVLGSHAKDVVLNAIQHFGVGLSKMNDWELTQSGNSLILEGDLELSDLRKVMSLLELPSSNFSTLSDSEAAEKDETDKVAEASLKYFKSVTTLVTDLQHEFRTNRDARRTMGIVYLNKYAKRIDALPILNVDKELTSYGLSVAESLRGTGVTQGMSGVNAGVRKSSVYETYDTRYNYNYNNNGGRYNDGSDYNSYRSSHSIKNQIAREESSVAVKARFNNWKEIDDASAKMRVKMTGKYNIEF